MTVIPNPLGAAARFREKRGAYVAKTAARPATLASLGRVHVIPAPQEAARARIAAALYRVLEIALASIGLIVTLPLMLAAAVLIRLDSPGPALFRHRRPARSIRLRGRDLQGRPDLIPPPTGYDPEAEYYVPAYFTLVKFRTMYHDARTRFPAYYAYNFSPENFHSQFPTLQNDPRVTRAGRMLRQLSLDELPNLWSVVTGDMSLVGPRPEAPEVLQYYTPEEMTKFTLRPGITGLAQASGRGLLNWGETLALDLQYVRTRSAGLDLKIILLTIKRVITRHGAF
jgi:lipopolysaccharide/colanic/teichoic acid biosynthesis glycosyltransferase